MTTAQKKIKAASRNLRNFSITVQNTGSASEHLNIWNKPVLCPFSLLIENPHPVAKYVKLFNALEDAEDTCNEVMIKIEKGWMSHVMLKKDIQAGIHYTLSRMTITAQTVKQLDNPVTLYSMNPFGGTSSTIHNLDRYRTAAHISNLQVTLDDMEMRFTGEEGIEMRIEPREQVSLCFLSDRPVNIERYEKKFDALKNLQQKMLNEAEREQIVADIMERDPEAFLAMLGGDDALRTHVIKTINN